MKSKQLLNERIYLLNELSKTIGKRSEDYLHNVWHDSSVKFLSNALRHEIDSNVAIAVPLMKDLAEQHSFVCSKLGVNLESSLIGVDDLISILSFASKSPFIPIEWVMESSNIDVLIDYAHKYKKQVEQIVKTSNELKSKFYDISLDYDVAKRKDLLCSLMSQLQAYINGESKNWISQNVKNVNEEIKLISNNIDLLFEEAKIISSKLGVFMPNTLEQIILFAKFMQILVDICDVRPTQTWFNSNDLIRIKSNIEIHRSLHDSVLELKKSILSRFDKEIFEWDFYSVLQRFRGEYKSFFRAINGRYRRDIKQLKSFLSKGGELSYNDALEVLNELKCFSDNQNIIVANEKLYTEDYGNYYLGENTQWSLLANDLEKFGNFVCYSHMINLQLQNLIVHGNLPISDIAQFITHYLASLVSTKN